LRANREKQSKLKVDKNKKLLNDQKLRIQELQNQIKATEIHFNGKSQPEYLALMEKKVSDAEEKFKKQADDKVAAAQNQVSELIKKSAETHKGEIKKFEKRLAEAKSENLNDIMKLSNENLKHVSNNDEIKMEMEKIKLDRIKAEENLKVAKKDHSREMLRYSTKVMKL